MALTKAEIKEKIDSGDPSIQLFPKDNTSLPVWQDFRVVFLDHVRLNWACCIKCKDIVAYSSTIGTSGLHRHPCVKKANAKIVLTRKPRATPVQRNDSTSDDDGDRKDIFAVEATPAEIKARQKSETKANLKERIIAGDPSIELKKPKNHTPLWNHYGIVFVNDKKLDWACCCTCKELLAFSQTSGTSSLRRHRCPSPAKVAMRKLQKEQQMRKEQKMQYIQRVVKVERPNINPLESALKEEMSVDVMDDNSPQDVLFVQEYAPTSAQKIKRSKPWTKAEIKEKIYANDPSVELKKPKNTRSQVWENFRVVFVDNKRAEWAYCIKCKKVLTYTGVDGTSGLNQHLCCKLYKLDHPEDDAPKCKPIPGNILHDFCRKQLSFVMKDLLPIAVLEGEGFREMAQALIDIGALYGKQNVDEVLKSRKTISRLVMPAEYDLTKAALKTQLSDQNLAFSIDIWTDEYKQRNFLTLTAHHITDEFKLAVNVLSNREFAQQQKFGKGIFKLVTDILTEFGLERTLSNGIFVTDNDANVKTAFQPDQRLSCACQNLNFIMNDALENGYIPELNLLIEASKALVTYFEHSEVNNLLSESLEPCVKSGWNSIFNMLNSIQKLYQEIRKILLKRNDVKLLVNIDYNFLKKLVDFLEPFKECSERLSLENEPVIQEYVLWHQKLINWCEMDTLDSEIIRAVKSTTHELLTHKFEPNNIHYVALFLNPPFKDLNCLPTEKREQVIASVKEALFNIYETNTNASSSNNFDKDEFACASDVDKQISTYMNMEIQQMEPILSFWEKSNDLHLLQLLSRQILCVPSSASISERVFSPSNQILAERRTHMLRENLNEIIFLNKNMKYNKIIKR